MRNPFSSWPASNVTGDIMSESIDDQAPRAGFAGRRGRRFWLIPFFVVLAVFLGLVRFDGVAKANGGPHGDYTAATDACAACHRTHTSPGSSLLVSVTTGDAFCFSCHNGTGANMPPIVSTHANVDFAGGVEGAFQLTCMQCHEPHGSTNLAIVRNDVYIRISPLLTTGPILFTSRTGTNSFDDGVSAPSSRICVICHTNAANPGYPMVNHDGGAGHVNSHNFVGQDCIVCHPHSADRDVNTIDGFMASAGCTICHSAPQGSRRQIVGAGGDFALTSHHIQGTPQDDDCKTCHDISQHLGGTVRLYNVDTGAVIPYTGGAIPEIFCAACHDGNGAAGNTTPFTDGVTVPNISAAWGASSHAASLTCYDCHDSGHGSNKQGLLSPWTATSDGDPDDPMAQEERFCYQCHDGSVASTDIETEFSRSSHHDVALTEQSADGSRLECINCHNPHMDTAANQNANPDDWYQQWTGRRVDFCLTCHDGAPPGASSAPPPAVSFPGAWEGTGYDKSAFENSVHDNMLSQWGCSHCHDEHGTDNISLLVARYETDDFTAYSSGAYQLCWTCHVETDIMNSRNAFNRLHNRHVNREDSPCIHCHDAHSSYDAGEEGLINFVYAVANMDVVFLSGRDQSTGFGISGNTGYCYLECHAPPDDEAHNPENYNRNNNQVSTTDCTTCHPGGPPPPSGPISPPGLVVPHPTAIATPQPVPTPTLTPTPALTGTPQPSNTPTPVPSTPTATPTLTPTLTVTPTFASSPTAVGTVTPAPTSTAEPPPADTPTSTPVPAETATPTATPSPTASPSLTPTPSANTVTFRRLVSFTRFLLKLKICAVVYMQRI